MTAEKQKRYTGQGGFSLIELLVVIGIITMLIGVLVPGMHAFRKRAQSLKEKAQIHSMNVGLELFKKNHGTLPESKAVQVGSQWVTGAQHLAEALVGRDERGFDPESEWHDGDEAAISDLYRNDNSTDEGKRSLNRRYPPSFELDEAVATEVDELYDTYTGGAGSVYCSDEEWSSGPVLTDIFNQKRIEYNGETVKVGTPVLYYRANRSSNRFPDVEVGVDLTKSNTWIYDYQDNYPLLQLGHIEATPELVTEKGYQHPMYAKPEKFYEMITNPKSRYAKPYHADGYLLWSAGYDGLFGTNDDVTNFEQ